MVISTYYYSYYCDYYVQRIRHAFCWHRSDRYAARCGPSVGSSGSARAQTRRTARPRRRSEPFDTLIL